MFTSREGIRSVVDACFWLLRAFECRILSDPRPRLGRRLRLDPQTGPLPSQPDRRRAHPLWTFPRMGCAPKSCTRPTFASVGPTRLISQSELIEKSNGGLDRSIACKVETSPASDL